MITDFYSWSLGLTPNESLGCLLASLSLHHEPSIRGQWPSGLNKVSVADRLCAQSEPSPLFATSFREANVSFGERHSRRCWERNRTSFVAEEIRGRPNREAVQPFCSSDFGKPIPIHLPGDPAPNHPSPFAYIANIGAPPLPCAIQHSASSISYLASPQNSLI